MKIRKTNNKIYFNYEEKSFGNITVSDNCATIELIKVIPSFRGARLATRTLLNIISYIRVNLKNITKIELTPLPLESNGLNYDQLVGFYKKYGFQKSYLDKFNKNLMVRYI